MDIRWIFFTYVCRKNCIVCLKRMKINEKEAGHGPLKILSCMHLNLRFCNFFHLSVSPSLCRSHSIQILNEFSCFISEALCVNIKHSGSSHKAIFSCYSNARKPVRRSRSISGLRVNWAPPPPQLGNSVTICVFFKDHGYIFVYISSPNIW